MRGTLENQLRSSQRQHPSTTKVYLHCHYNFIVKTSDMRLISVRSTHLIYLCLRLLFCEGGGGLWFFHFKKCFEIYSGEAKITSDNFSRDLLNCDEEQSIWRNGAPCSHMMWTGKAPVDVGGSVLIYASSEGLVHFLWRLFHKWVEK